MYSETGAVTSFPSSSPGLHGLPRHRRALTESQPAFLPAGRDLSMSTVPNLFALVLAESDAVPNLLSR